MGKVLTALTLLALVLVGCGAPAEQGTAASPAPTSDPDSQYDNARRRMVERDLRGRDLTDEKVLAAMARIPRHRFVPEQHRSQAYEDRPLPIGFGQTISQPYMVAVMTQLLELKPGEKVLEIGTGSGYQAAVLAEITPHVYSVEIIEQLAERARDVLQDLGYEQVKTTVGDGYFGWEEHAPYDAIIVTCAPDHIPQPLVSQLRDGGRMVIPIGPPGLYQSLWKIERKGDQIVSKNVMGVAFVPMTGVADKR